MSDEDGGTLDNLLDLIASMDLFDALIDPLLGGLLFADWKGSLKRWGLSGLVTEFLSAISGNNCKTIHFSRRAGFSGIEVERLLGRHGVKIWGRFFTPRTLFFRVKKRQARWAEYLVLRYGVPVVSAPVDSRNLA